MNHVTPWTCLLSMALALTLAGCANDGGREAGYLDDLPAVVLPGKEDNFLSTSAQEYLVEGVTTVTIEDELADADEETKLARVRELIPLKQVVVGWFLNAYLVEKSSHDSNEEYGGFKALTKNGSYEDMDIQAREDGLTYEFRFRQEVGGQMDLLGAMGLHPDAEGNAQFDLTIGRISNSEMAQLETNAEWYRRSPWSAFDPSSVDAERLDTVTLTLRPEPRSDDAWMDYARLFEDGRVTVGIHYGWDYHSEYHIKHAREVYDWLVGQGFTSPVASFDELAHDSGPLTREIRAGDDTVQVEISIFTGKPGTATNPDTDAGGRLLEDLMRESFRDREVIVFSGHSGPFYGFALANWRRTDEGDLDDSEIPGLEMPLDVYQVVFAEGCDTYAVGQAFWLNPNKPGRANLDVITTTSFSNAATPAAVKDFLTALVGTDTRGDHEPVRFTELLKDLDGNSYWFSTMYGVHGLDDNPHLHPYADVEALCAPCRQDSDCGGYGMQCTRFNADEAGCAAECTADDGCPEGYSCEKVSQGSWITSRYCVPANADRTCVDTTVPAPSGAEIVINEVLADPSSVENEGDANGDGHRDAVEDEFVELLNVGATPADLGLWTISDGCCVRFTFPAGTTLAPGAALLVFGGGEVGSFGSLGGATVLVSEYGLGLSNKGDVVTLAAADGEIVDRVQWGAEGGRDTSLVRSSEGDKGSPLVPHPVVAHSAGLDQSGQPF